MPEGGSIVNTASINLFIAWENDAPYTRPPKGALHAVSRAGALALDLVAARGSGVRANCVCPGRRRRGGGGTRRGAGRRPARGVVRQTRGRQGDRVASPSGTRRRPRGLRASTRPWSTRSGTAWRCSSVRGVARARGEPPADLLERANRQRDDVPAGDLLGHPPKPSPNGCARVAASRPATWLHRLRARRGGRRPSSAQALGTGRNPGLERCPRGHSLDDPGGRWRRSLDAPVPPGRPAPRAAETPRCREPR